MTSTVQPSHGSCSSLGFYGGVCVPDMVLFRHSRSNCEAYADCSVQVGLSDHYIISGAHVPEKLGVEFVEPRDLLGISLEPALGALVVRLDDLFHLLMTLFQVLDLSKC